MQKIIYFEFNLFHSLIWILDLHLRIDAAFGNSRWDTDMLSIAKHAFAVNANPDLEAAARERGWTVYFPDGTRE